MSRTRSVFCMVLLFVTSFGTLLRAQSPVAPTPGGIPPAQTRVDSTQTTQPAAATRPESVPEGYGITPFGYFDPSCVFHMAEGETLLEKGTVLQHKDGTLENIPACQYPHYTANGKLVSADGTKADPTISGWTEYASTTIGTSYGEIVANWVVPPAPTSIASPAQTDFFFTGLEDINDVVSILQPVLQYGASTAGGGNYWAIASWNCCPAGNSWYSTLVDVSSGDTIQGTIESTCGAGTESCSTWNVTTADVTSSNSTTLSNTSSDGQTFNWAFGGVIEVYGVAQCANLPSSGYLDFHSIGLYDYNFNLISNPSWTMGYPAASETPQCGYVGYPVATKVALDYGSAGAISTAAGNGTYGYSGDGGPATSAEEAEPSDVVFDTAGNVYIAEWANSRIREISASTGDINTVAGDGTPGYSGDGGPATSAELYNPGGIAMDSSGNIYIADTNNYRIRKVTASTGIITTVAGNGTYGYSGDGGPATSAELAYPEKVALDGSGNIYIADSYNERIRKVTASTGVITTVAGNGTAGYSGDGGPATSAELSSPAGVALDSSGNIYIADLSNSRIRKVTVSTGVITTVAGNGTAGYSGDGGPATSAEIFFPFSVATDSGGNFYIADFDNCRIRLVTVASGTISTAAGDGTCGYGGDGGTAIGAELNSPIGVRMSVGGSLYIPDTYNNRTRSVVP